MTIVHSARCLEYEAPGHPERPARVAETVKRLQGASYRWVEAQPCTTAQLLRVHTASHMEAVRTGHYDDADTPFFPQMDAIARLAAGAAVQAARLAMDGEPAFSLMRPPGHHAERNHIMGFCYYNNIAVAVAELLEATGIRRVAILDFDCHHGNGTEQIFLGDDRVQFISLHQSPCYPGTGTMSRANARNYPLPPGTAPVEFLATLKRAWDDVRAFAPQVLAVSAGFDMYHRDPITHMALDEATYEEVGRQVGRWGGPTFAVLEGGYARELPECVAAFLRGWSNAA
ncbi:MAG: histone deacetylase [Verrucomicrobiae bacterium]|nr:histone deacetylase [Verrucomicrobiae bacterium]